MNSAPAPGQIFALAALCLGLNLASGTGHAESEPVSQTVEQAISLQQDAKENPGRDLPFVIFVSQQGCEYCKLLRNQVLQPMIRTGQFENTVVLREISLDEGFELVDFQGQKVKGRRFAQRYGAAVTPTLLFLDAQGNSLARPMVGVNTIEFYGYYLELRIKEARMALSEKR